MITPGFDTELQIIWGNHLKTILPKASERLPGTSWRKFRLKGDGRLTKEKRLAEHTDWVGVTDAIEVIEGVAQIGATKAETSRAVAYALLFGWAVALLRKNNSLKTELVQTVIDSGELPIFKHLDDYDRDAILEEAKSSHHLDLLRAAAVSDSLREDGR